VKKKEEIEKKQFWPCLRRRVTRVGKNFSRFNFFLFGKTITPGRDAARLGDFWQ
jgi:hypothetical protein